MVKLKRFLLIFIFIFSLFGVFGALPDENEVRTYYKFDNNLFTDSTPNGFDATNSGTTNTSGIIGDARNFDGTNDYITSVDFAYPDNNWSMNLWVWRNSGLVGEDRVLIHTGTNRIQILDNGGINDIRWNVIGDGGSFDRSTGTAFTNDGWAMLTLTRDGNNFSLYKDAVLIDTLISAVGFINPTNNLLFGTFDTTQLFWEGKIDEFMFYNETLTTSQINSLYAGGSPTIAEQYPFIGSSEITYNNPQNNSFYNNASQLLNLSFSETTNATYIFNGGNETTICTNCDDSANITLTLVAGVNNLTVLTDTLGLLFNSTISFTLDTTNPTITNNIPAEINDYNFNGTLFTCTDTNLGTCNISINGFNKATGTNFTLTNNGNLSYIINATDLAGNSVTETGVLLVNPIIYFFFEDLDTSTLLTDFVFGGKASNNDTWNSTIYNDVLVLGENNLVFNLTGYPLTTFSFNITNTTTTNFTFQIDKTDLNITIRDKETGSIITGVTFNLEFIGLTGFNTTTTTGTKQIEGILVSSDYRMIVTSADYETESIFFTFNDQENLDITAYVFNATDINSGFVNLEVVDINGQPLEDVLGQGLQWDVNSASFIEVSECKTAQDGKCELNVILDDKVYKFKGTLNGFSVETVEQIITTANNGRTITITLDTTQAQIPNFRLQDVIYSTTETFNESTNTSLVTFTWENTLGTDITGCINVYRVSKFTETKVTGDNCTTTDSTTLMRSYTLDLSNYDYNIKAEFLIDGVYYVAKTYTYNQTSNLFFQLRNYGLHYFILILLNIVSIFAGIQLQNIYIGTIGLIVSSLISIIIAPTLVTTSVAGFLLVIGVITILGGSRP